MSETAELIAELIDNQRRLTNWYLKRIPEDKFDERIDFNGGSINSAYWITAHIIWADEYLCLRPLSSEYKGPSWVDNYGFGSNGDLAADRPSITELIEELKFSRDRVTSFIRTLSDDILESKYPLESLGFKNTKYGLYHVIRHEGVHCGQLSSICALLNIKTV